MNQPNLIDNQNTMQPPIVVEGLTKSFGSFMAVDHVSFSVHAGDVFGWLGPNGAGKTTTIRMLLGLIKPTSGSASVLGFDPVTQTKTMQARVGYMSQQFTLYNELTARENIQFYGKVYGLERDELKKREGEIMQMAGLVGRENVLTSRLSGGWKQRLALGCAIVHRPKVVFLDEPTAGVDPISRRDFWGLIYAMAKKGVTVLVTTHYMDEAELCQRVGFISQGRLVALELSQPSQRDTDAWPGSGDQLVRSRRGNAGPEGRSAGRSGPASGSCFVWRPDPCGAARSPGV